MIKIFTDRKQKELHNFWNHIVFHPTDAIEDDWGKRILDKIAEDKAVKTVRIYSMMEDIFTLDENGNLQADYTLNDYRIDYLISKGFNLLLSYAFIPPWMSEDVNAINDASQKSGTRYKGKRVITGKPTRYDKWQELCQMYTQHLVDRYGEDTVAKWRLLCYNEPDLLHFFYRDAPDNLSRFQEYAKLYDGFEAGITAVSRKLQIGGVALAHSTKNFEFMEWFLNHVRENNRKLDFISFHSYGTSPSSMNSGMKPLDIRGALYNTNTLVRVIEMCGFGHLPIVCDEWGAATHGYFNIEECPAFIFRENEIYSAYFVKMLTHFEEIGVPYDEMMLCLSGQHEMKTDFSGFRNFFTLNFYPKPIYNAYVLAAKLGNAKLYHYADRALMDLSVMPTRHDDGHMSILLGYADDAFTRQLPDKDVAVNFLNLDGTYTVTKYLIDATHANAIVKYRELGCPDDPTEEQKQAIRDFAALKPEVIGTVSPDAPIIDLVMENNAVVLLEVTKA